MLRNRTCCIRLGAQVLSDLHGSVAIPRQTGTATAYALPESATMTKSTLALDQIMMTPHRVGTSCEFTRQLVLQASQDIEDLVRDDLARTTGIKLDYLMLQGTGANSEPCGIFNVPGIGSMLFGGAVTWNTVVSFEDSLAAANADVSGGRFGYVTTPKVRTKWKTTPKIGSTFPVFIWEDGPEVGSPDGKVNNYLSTATNQILNNAVVFGQWRDLVLGIFGPGPDILVNPYSRDTDACVRITSNLFVDVAVRHAPSFCWSADAGNQ